MQKLDRRHFLIGMSSGIAASRMVGLGSSSSPILFAGPELKGPWYQRSYRRNVIDMHIADWDQKFLSEFDAKTYVDLLRLAGVQSAVVYAHSHVGHCNFPTKVGHTHNGMQGKTHLQDVITLCHRNGIAVQLYYSVIFDRWAYDNHPDWRIILVNGKPAGETVRHGLNCPNSPYRDYVVSLTEEMCQQLDFDGIRYDMTFWPNVCYCTHCQKRFAAEVGGELPKIIQWEDPHWVSFQRKREEWLLDFAHLLTQKVRSLKPQATVEHQASTYPQSWRLGVTYGLTKQCDFLQGDFYGDALQGSFVRKLFYNLSENQPYGFETSVMVSLRNHTAKKSKDLLRTKAYACLADAGAFVFIDAIDPVGTLNRSVYQRMGEIFGETRVYEQYLGGGKLCEDVAVYLSTESKFDFADNGKAPDDPKLSPRLPHVDAALGAVRALIDQHIPYGVITKKNLGSLARYKILILPNVLMMDLEEVEAIRNYVRSGGSLYASKYTSLTTKDGRRQKDFLLADVFGCSFVGETEESKTFISPSPGKAADLFGGYTSKYPAMLDDAQLIVKSTGTSQVLATLVLPYTNPSDTSKFASIHSNPPGIPTHHPAVLMNQFGKGKVIYATGDIENNEIAREIFIQLLKQLFDRFKVEANAPVSVEVTTFDQPDKKRYLISLINFQKDLPNIPVDNIKLRVRLDGKVAKRLLLLPEEKPLPYEKNLDVVELSVPRLETFHMLSLEYM